MSTEASAEFLQRIGHETHECLGPKCVFVFACPECEPTTPTYLGYMHNLGKLILLCAGCGSFIWEMSVNVPVAMIALTNGEMR